MNPAWVTVMGCAMQHQICDFANTNCSDLTGWYELGNASTFTGSQGVIAQNLYAALGDSDINQMAFHLGSAGLNANLYLLSADGVISAPPQGSSGLPSWANEVSSWHNWSMAQIQRGVISIAAGPYDQNLNALIDPPPATDKAIFDICRQTKVIDSDFYSFNVIGLAVTIIVGFAIILINLTLPVLVELFRRIFKTGADRQGDWTSDYLLQIQRIAFEKDGIINWEGRENSIPTTTSKVVFHSPRHSLSNGSGHALYSPIVQSPQSMGSESMTSFPGFTAYKPEPRVSWREMA